MMHREWKDLKIVEDKNNPFSVLYEYPHGESFYIEPIFYNQLTLILDRHPKEEKRILEEMHSQVIKNKKVIFTGSYEMSCTHKDGYIYLELEDITNKLKIFVEDKSRGSDYGD